jgi:hypothetical protein
MTLVIALKVGDGIVLGADSASTVMIGDQYHNSYFNAEKLFNVRKGIPVGALTYGLGGLAGRSIASLAKDLRLRFSDPTQGDWHLPPETYSVEEVVRKMKKFFFDEIYEPQFRGKGALNGVTMGFIVGGYSAGKKSAEIWEIVMDKGSEVAVQQVAGPDLGWSIYWRGQTEAVQRLIRGWSPQTLQSLEEAGLETSVAVNLLDSVQPMINGIMPIQDAIDFVHYLMDVTCGYIRFSPGNATVAQPVDSAAITPYEGFRWIRRKHYYSASLNTPSARELP